MGREKSAGAVYVGGGERSENNEYASYAVVSEGSDRCLRVSVSIVYRGQQRDKVTHFPSSLFILNISILSVLNTAFNAPSHKISRPFVGFCKLLDLIYAHNFLTTCGRESEASWTSAAKGSLHA